MGDTNLRAECDIFEEVNSQGTTSEISGTILVETQNIPSHEQHDENFPFTYDSRTHLETRRSLNNEKWVNCKDCFFSCKGKTRLRRHIKRAHPSSIQLTRNLWAGSSLMLRDKENEERGAHKHPLFHYESTSVNDIRRYGRRAHVIATHVHMHSASSHSKNRSKDECQKNVEDKKYICDKCDNQYKHKTMSHASKMFNMSEQNQILEPESHSIGHIRSQKGENFYKCNQCDFQSSLCIELKVHKRREHTNRESNLSTQNPALELENSLSTMSAEDTREKQYKCNRCDYQSSWIGDLRIHQRAKHGIQRTMRMPQSQPGTSSHLFPENNRDEKQHESTIHQSGERRSTIPRSIHSSGAVKMHSCYTCSSIFVSKHDLLEHRRTHTREELTTCQWCNRRFRTARERRVHMEEHLEGIQFFPCRICGKEYLCPSNLRTHEFTHPEVEPYCCIFCEYTCRSESNLTLHVMRVHAHEKAHKCTKCDREFPSFGDLHIHLQAEHEEMLYKCAQCGYQYSSEHELYSHISKFHDDSE